ncbi:unnamed protein product [Blepharisma stoltei]|uniref:Uncharacterized protein n=1 Tax=Blepharisma stoltei TaxID=1481888 RepID=A0AAU9IMA3_9CILI|nr:unnamed protein product [Blepharisma stoltei]
MEKELWRTEQNIKEDDWEILNDNEQNECTKSSNDWKQQEQYWRSQQNSWNQKLKDYKEQENYWLSQASYWSQFSNSKP